jgi:hypothetical protein
MPTKKKKTPRALRTARAAKARDSALVARITTLQNGLRAVRSRLSALERYATTAKQMRETVARAEAAPLSEELMEIDEAVPPARAPLADGFDEDGCCTECHRVRGQGHDPSCANAPITVAVTAADETEDLLDDGIF